MISSWLFSCPHQHPCICPWRTCSKLHPRQVFRPFPVYRKPASYGIETGLYHVWMTIFKYLPTSFLTWASSLSQSTLLGLEDGYLGFSLAVKQKEGSISHQWLHTLCEMLYEEISLIQNAALPGKANTYWYIKFLHDSYVSLKFKGCPVYSICFSKSDLNFGRHDFISTLWRNYLFIKHSDFSI